jgi:F-type H+-transporting ATPase subunit b
MMVSATRVSTQGVLSASASTELVPAKVVSKRATSIREFFRACFLVALMVGFAGVVSLRAQDKPAASEPKQSNDSSAQKPRGPAQEVVHESREAAGEEKDETAQFKQSASVQWIARMTGLNLRRSYWLSMITNFIVIAAVIFWAARKYLPGMFRDRTAAIQKAMQEAQKVSEDARRRLADIESRLMKLDVEIAMMRDAAEKEGVAEEARIKAAAEEDTRKIVASAEQEIAAAAKAARRQLTAHAADLAVGLAQKQIRVDAATDQGLVRRFSGQLGAEKPSAENHGKDKN